MINIVLTEHVCLRYIERFNPQLSSIKNEKQRIDRAKIAIMAIIQNAHYVSDDPRGVLLYSPSHNCNLIMRHKKLITLYTPDAKIRKREKKHRFNSDVYEN